MGDGGRKADRITHDINTILLTRNGLWAALTIGSGTEAVCIHSSAAGLASRPNAKCEEGRHDG